MHLWSRSLGNGIGAQQMIRMDQWIFIQYQERGSITWAGECLEADRAICLLLWWEEGTVYLGMYTHVHVLTSDRAQSPNRNSRNKQLLVFPCKAQVVCSHLWILTFSFPNLCCKKFFPKPRNTGLNQFRVSVSSGSSLCYRRWAGSWQEARVVALSALLPVAMPWVSSNLGKMPLDRWIRAFVFFLKLICVAT